MADRRTTESLTKDDAAQDKTRARHSPERRAQILNATIETIPDTAEASVRHWTNKTTLIVVALLEFEPNRLPEALFHHSDINFILVGAIIEWVIPPTAAGIRAGDLTLLSPDYDGDSLLTSAANAFSLVRIRPITSCLGERVGMACSYGSRNTAVSSMGLARHRGLRPMVTREAAGVPMCIADRVGMRSQKPQQHRGMLSRIHRGPTRCRIGCDSDGSRPAHRHPCTTSHPMPATREEPARSLDPSR